MAQVVFEHEEKERTEESVLECSCVHPCLHSLLPLISSHIYTFQALKHFSTTEILKELQNCTTAKYQSSKISEVADWIELNDFKTTEKKMMLKLNPVFLAAIN